MIGRRASLQRPFRRLAFTVAGLLSLSACGGDERPAEDAADAAPGLEAVAEPPGTRGTDADRMIFQETMEWAASEGLDSLPIGDVMVRIGERFVGTTYTPGTLDAAGEERLVINLRELDCVTYLENMLAMARLIRSGNTTFDAFQGELERIRYRGGKMQGYPSRLHYFSEWIQDNEDKGLVRNITRELGGVQDSEPIHFMTDNAEAYRQLSDPEIRAQIADMEERLSPMPRYMIPQERIGEVASGIRDGDIIAATSSLPGLDVAHTGMAVWRDGALHLMHAPLVGRSVEISELPLAERILDIEKQDGIMVARPQ